MHTPGVMVLYATSLLLLGAGTAVGGWYLDASGGPGISDQKWSAHGEQVGFELDFESINVWRYGLGAGTAISPVLEVGSEVALSERGGALAIDLGTFPPGRKETIAFERLYLDASLSLRRWWGAGKVRVGIGVGSRVSRLLDEREPLFFDLRPERWIFGVDPEARLAYSFGYAWVGYRFDLSRSYQVSDSKMRDRAGYAGVGVRWQ